MEFITSWFFAIKCFFQNIIFNGKIVKTKHARIAIENNVLYKSRGGILRINGYVKIRPYCILRISKKAILEIGDGCFINSFSSINCQKQIIIGDNTLIGEGVRIYDHNHNFRDNNLLIKNSGMSCKSVTIGSNCWIGSNTVVLAGVSIGNNSVIGAGCIVYKNVPENTLMFNNGTYKRIERNTIN